MPLTRKQKLICWLAYGLVWLFHSSYRYRRINAEVRETAKAQHSRGLVAYACWHQNALSTVMAHSWRRMAVLVSRSFDGEIIAFVIKHFGIHSSRGSSSRGGREALRELIKLTNAGYEIGITVDGPRGPRYEVKAGVITLASRTGIPILPTASRGRRSWTLVKSWDHFRVPKPFTEVLVLYGEPILVPEHLNDEDLQATQTRITESLMELEQQLASMVTLDQPQTANARI